MTMQILEIILYSKNGKKRVLAFSLGKVNIITGSSATGKSAIIDIVDYCLGSNDCPISIGVIRDTVSWFGLRIQLDSKQMFIARANPNSNRSTIEAYIEQGMEVKSPDKPPTEGNTTINAIVMDLTKKINIEPNLNVPPTSQTRDSLEANFRHALLFCYQQQNEIANRSTLFHRQSEFGIAQAIKDTFPYIIGAIDSEEFILRQKLVNAKKNLLMIKHSLQEIEEINGEGFVLAKTLLEESINVGIIDENKSIEEISQIIKIFKKIKNWEPQKYVVHTSDRLTSLQDKYNGLSAQLTKKSDQIKTAKIFTEETNGFENESMQQKSRLESIELFKNMNNDKHCPVCSGEFTDTIPTIKSMTQSISEIDQNLKSTANERPRLKEYIEQLEKEYSGIYQKLNEMRHTINSIIDEEEYNEHIDDINLRRAKIVGKISLWLDTVKIVDSNHSLKNKFRNAEQEVMDIENQLENSGKQNKIDYILNILGNQISSWSGKLKLEHSGNPVRLDIKNTTIIIDREDRPIPLKKMGSGENWVWYHIITHFALHQYFVKHNRPVPRFIFLDQPSQVYYPMDKDDKFEGSVDKLSDDDRESLSQMYKFIFEFAEKLSPNFQIIIMDHADLADNTFQSSVVEKWRDGNALIPQDWIDKE